MARSRRRSQAARTAGRHANKSSHMIDLNHIDDLARRLSDLVPPGLRESREELQQTFKSALQSGLSQAGPGHPRGIRRAARGAAAHAREARCAGARRGRRAGSRTRFPATPAALRPRRHESCAGAQPCTRRRVRASGPGGSAPVRRPADDPYRRPAGSGGARIPRPRARRDPLRAVRISRSAASPSTWPRPTCPRTAAASTCRSRSASSPPAARSTATHWANTNSSANWA